jgi:hypothetical protein
LLTPAVFSLESREIARKPEGREGMQLEVTGMA